MLEYFNNQAQPLADDVKITDHEVTTADGATLLARWYRRSASDTAAAVLYLHGGGMIVGPAPIFDGPVSRYVARTGVPMLSVQYRRAPEVSSQPDDGSFSNSHRSQLRGHLSR